MTTNFSTPVAPGHVASAGLTGGGDDYFPNQADIDQWAAAVDARRASEADEAAEAALQLGRAS